MVLFFSFLFSDVEQGINLNMLREEKKRFVGVHTSYHIQSGGLFLYISVAFHQGRINSQGQEL